MPMACPRISTFFTTWLETTPAFGLRLHQDLARKTAINTAKSQGAFVNITPWPAIICLANRI